VATENEDPILLITDEDDPSQPTAKLKVENAHLSDGLVAPITTTEAENLAFSPPPVKAIKCRLKSYDQPLRPIQMKDRKPHFIAVWNILTKKWMIVKKHRQLHDVFKVTLILEALGIPL
jgi:hypothetical protein